MATDYEKRRIAGRLPQDNKPDAHDKHLPLTPPGQTKGDPHPEYMRDRSARNPYLQSIAPPTYLFICPSCDQRKAENLDAICVDCALEIAKAGLLLLEEEAGDGEDM